MARVIVAAAVITALSRCSLDREKCRLASVLSLGTRIFKPDILEYVAMNDKFGQGFPHRHTHLPIASLRGRPSKLLAVYEGVNCDVLINGERDTSGKSSVLSGMSNTRLLA